MSPSDRGEWRIHQFRGKQRDDRQWKLDVPSAGAIYLGAASLPGHVTIDDRSDATSRQATFKPVPSTAFFALAGLSPAAININSTLTLSHFDIYGAAASSYSFQWAPQNTRLFAGAGSSVELKQSTFFTILCRCLSSAQPRC